jgi:hypothetical protein
MDKKIEELKGWTNDELTLTLMRLVEQFRQYSVLVRDAEKRLLEIKNEVKRRKEVK